MKELEEIIAALSRKCNHSIAYYTGDLQILVDAASEGRRPFDVQIGDHVEPMITYVLAKLLQRIDKLEDEVHELRSHID